LNWGAVRSKRLRSTDLECTVYEFMIGNGSLKNDNKNM